MGTLMMCCIFVYVIERIHCVINRELCQWSLPGQFNDFCYKVIVNLVYSLTEGTQL